ncbi:MAG: glycosyltransferase family 39 protein [Planctomycetes bacterium]|nr:glycosyltransferase family 39 protein [Planctomycetota bacterium]
MSAPASTPRWIPWAAALLLLLAALVPRARDLGGPWDRSFEGFQGAFFAQAAVNYERGGLALFDGYPVLNVELDPLTPSTWYTYENHPPTVAWLAWLGFRAAGGDASTPPSRGREWGVRLPFLALHMATLLVLWLALREAVGLLESCCALALLAACPLSALYGTLVNYETPTGLAVALAALFHVRWLRRGARRDLFGIGAAFALGGAFTYAPLFFAPPFALQAWRRRGGRAALAELAVAGGACLLPLLAHGALASHALESIGRSAAPLQARALLLWGPLLDGSIAPWDWLLHQLSSGARLYSWPLALCAALGLCGELIFGRRDAQHPIAQARIALGPVLLAGGLLANFAFYRHSAEEQWTFLLNPVLGLTACAAALIRALGRPFERGRLPHAPYVALCGVVVLPALAQLEWLRHEWRGTDRPLPDAIGRELGELLPAGSVLHYPPELGFTPAVGYYAWRTQVPWTSELEPLVRPQLARVGLAAAERYYVLPRRGEAELEPALAPLRTARLAERAPDRSSANWLAWKL